MSGILKTIGCRPILINGVADHGRLLFAAPANLAVTDVMRAVKAKSSSRMRGRDPEFAWQVGYAAVSVSRSNVDAVKKYIASQDKHHTARAV